MGIDDLTKLADQMVAEGQHEDMELSALRKAMHSMGAGMQAALADTTGAIRSLLDEIRMEKAMPPMGDMDEPADDEPDMDLDDEEDPEDAAGAEDMALAVDVTRWVEEQAKLYKSTDRKIDLLLAHIETQDRKIETLRKGLAQSIELNAQTMMPLVKGVHGIVEHLESIPGPGVEPRRGAGRGLQMHKAVPPKPPTEFSKEILAKGMQMGILDFVHLHNVNHTGKLSKDAEEHAALSAQLRQIQ